MQLAYDNFRASTHMTTSPECAQLYPGEKWKCIVGQYRMPLIKTPYLLLADQYDSYQLGMHMKTGIRKNKHLSKA